MATNGNRAAMWNAGVLTVNAGPELAATIRRLADDRNVSLSRIIRDALALTYGESLDAETREAMRATISRLNAQYDANPRSGRPRRALTATAGAVPGAEQSQPGTTEGQARHFAMAS